MVFFIQIIQPIETPMFSTIQMILYQKDGKIQTKLTQTKFLDLELVHIDVCIGENTLVRMLQVLKA